MKAKVLVVSKVLPDELILQILARIPIKFIYKFKSVCKSWYKLLSGNYFINLYNQISMKNPRVLIEVSDTSRRSKPKILCVDRLFSVSRLKLDFIKDRVKIIASCNGLLCCSSIPRKGVYYVCNPITRQYEVLPTISEELVTSSFSYPDCKPRFIGLACDYFNQQYNMFLAGYCWPEGGNKKVVCLVFNSETKKWSKLNSIQDDYFTHMNLNEDVWGENCVYVNGSSYRLSDGDFYITFVDIKLNNVGMIRLPVEVRNQKDNRVFLFVYDGHVAIIQASDTFLTIWVVKDKYIKEWEVVEKLSSRHIRGMLLNRISQSGDYMFFASQKKVVMYNRSTKLWTKLFSVRDGCNLPMRCSVHSFRSRSRVDKRSVSSGSRVQFPEGTAERFQRIMSEFIPGKTPEEVEEHYKAFNSSNNNMLLTNVEDGMRHGTWSKDEHDLFLKGHYKHGNQWSLIHKEFVKTRTGSQIASHAQKYYSSQNKVPKGHKSVIGLKSGTKISKTKQSCGQNSGKSIIEITPHGNQMTIFENPNSSGCTFFRDVISLCAIPDIMDKAELSGLFSADVIKRAREILNQISESTTNKQNQCPGIHGLRETVASGIKARDNYPAHPDEIFMTDGVTPAVNMIIKLLITAENDGIMCPIPQYHLYSDSIALHGGTLVPYYLHEASGWRLKISELEKQLNVAKLRGIDVKALVVINPGNPTGQVLVETNQHEIVEFCKKHKLVLLADESDQDNIFVLDKKFISFKSISRKMGYSEKDISLVSFQSLSKAYNEEYGKTGGYMEVTGFSHEVRQHLWEVASQNLRANIPGQILTSLMMNPPKVGDECYQSYSAHKQGILSSFARGSKAIEDALNGLEGVSCSRVEGGIYFFPCIELTKKSIKAAETAKTPPDAFYCRRLLNETNISVLPGSSFGQVNGTWHFRVVIINQEDQVALAIDRLTNFHKRFMDEFRDN